MNGRRQQRLIVRTPERALDIPTIMMTFLSHDPLLPQRFYGAASLPVNTYTLFSALV